MRKVLLFAILIFLCFTSTSFAYRCVYSETVRDSAGNIMANATVRAYIETAGTQATIYEEVDSTSSVSSVSTGSDGSFEFYVDRFDYDSDQKFQIIVTKGSSTKTYDDVTIDRVVMGTYAGDKTLTTTLRVPEGVIYSGTITVSTGTVIAGLYQIFSGSVTGLTEVYPEWWGATTSGDNATALQAAFTAAAHGKVKLTQQYTSASAIAIDHYTIVEGNGLSSGITFSGTGDGLTSTWPINSSTAANITIRDLYLYNTNAGNTGGGIVDVGGTFFKVEGVKVQGFAYGLILDQTEIALIKGCEFVGQLTGGVWLVNGNDHTALASQNYTNRITIEDNQINESTGVYNIIDDGGVTHSINNNNFNGGATAMRMAGIYGLTFMGNQSEGHDAGLYFANATLSGTSVVDSSGVFMGGNVLMDGVVSYNIGIDFVHGLEIRGNHFGQAMGAAILFMNTTANVATHVAVSNNVKSITGVARTAAPFIDGSALPVARVDYASQKAYTYVATAQAGTGAIQATPATMEFIHVGSRLVCQNEDGTDPEEITVTAVDATTFTATFTIHKAANYLVMGATATNNTGTLTLAANAATTTIVDNSITSTSRIILTPTSANAAADQGSATGVWVSTKTDGTSFVLTHPNNANADKTFDYVVIK